MEWLDEVPHPCEVDFLLNASIIFCQGDDGLADGLISDPYACNFDLFAQIGKSFKCPQTGMPMNLTLAATIAANNLWTDPRSTSGDFLYYGPNIGADLTGNIYHNGQGWTATDCTANETCVPQQQMLFSYWYTYSIEKNVAFNDSLNLTHAEHDMVFDISSTEYNSIIGTSDPDLSRFRDRDVEKLVSNYTGTHAGGTAPIRGTQRYYDAVTAITPDVHDFYRFFEAPGTCHCSGGPGGQPTTAFDSMRLWVEDGTVPEILPVTFNDINGTLNSKFLCTYPARARYNDTRADSTVARCFFCS